MSDLRMNKIFGAVLATGLVILGLRQVSELVYATPEVEKPGYAIEVQEASTEAAPVADVPPDWGTVLPTADVAAGQTVSTKCASCHSFVEGGPDMTGPDLYSVIGRKPGSKAGFPYSPAMVDFGSKNPGGWDYDHLYEFLAKPQGYLNGTKMTFVGLKKPEERIALIAWLRQQSENPAPIPAPKPAAAAEAAPAEGGETATAAPAEGAAAAGAPGAPATPAAQ